MHPIRPPLFSSFLSPRAALPFAFCVLATGCSTPSAGTGPAPTNVEDAATEDATTEASVDANAPDVITVDAADASDDAQADAGCNGILCHGVCQAASDCRGCQGAPLLCRLTATCVAACDGCVDEARDASAPIACFACDSSGHNPLGTCEPDDGTGYCLGGNYFGAYIDGGAGYHCDCTDGGVAACPGSSQVCAPIGAASQCLTCGELTIANTQGAPCADGGMCSTAEHVCR